MTHARQTIREAFVTALTGLSTTGARVYASRTQPLSRGDLPALLVYAQDENAETSSGRTLDRTVTITVEGVAAANSDLDDTLDDIAEEVEAAIGADPTVGGVVRDAVYQASEIEFDPDGETQGGMIRLAFAVDYRTTESNPGTIVS